MQVRQQGGTKTTSFVENSTEAGILLGGNGYQHSLGKLASLDRSWQLMDSNKGSSLPSGMARIEPMPSESESDWTLLSP